MKSFYIQQIQANTTKSKMIFAKNILNLRFCRFSTHPIVVNYIVFKRINIFILFDIINKITAFLNKKREN